MKKSAVFQFALYSCLATMLAIGCANEKKGDEKVDPEAGNLLRTSKASWLSGIWTEGKSDQTLQINAVGGTFVRTEKFYAKDADGPGSPICTFRRIGKVKVTPSTQEIKRRFKEEQKQYEPELRIEFALNRTELTADSAGNGNCVAALGRANANHEWAYLNSMDIKRLDPSRFVNAWYETVYQRVASGDSVAGSIVCSQNLISENDKPSKAHIGEAGLTAGDYATTAMLAAQQDSELKFRGLFLTLMTPNTVRVQLKVAEGNQLIQESFLDLTDPNANFTYEGFVGSTRHTVRVKVTCRR